jgi:hypothetical protein
LAFARQERVQLLPKRGQDGLQRVAFQRRACVFGLAWLVHAQPTWVVVVGGIIIIIIIIVNIIIIIIIIIINKALLHIFHTN